MLNLGLRITLSKYIILLNKSQNSLYSKSFLTYEYHNQLSMYIKED